ncbi:uncharacterized protein LOC120071970 [Benincasa hispida]|uniref:uncharacterized protein LOC120071970 n=1 Tax=Benincasa hispida TaxID=102211 RepID=UPI0019004F10|nr:uncharacterized protein LOC120071970 [Benincasa hispida]
MPSYVKFLKDILAKKRKIGENETVALTYECIALFQNNIPTKMKDPRSFTLPCSIGGKEVGNVLCDLGASINLLPLSIFKKLNIGNARPTTIKLQLADRSIMHLEGKIEDLLVQVDKFIFPVDFIILDYEADIEVPIILGHPFLAIGRALIDVQKGELTIMVDDQQVKFNILNALKYPSDMENYQYVGELQEEHWHEPLEKLEEKDFGISAMWEENCVAIQTESGFETLKLSERTMQRTKPSLEEPPMLELKSLPVHLKYVYLGSNNTLPVIISASLSKEKEEALIQILKNNAKALGWTLVNIRGINPSYCMHKIRLEEGKTGSIERQRAI